MLHEGGILFWLCPVSSSTQHRSKSQLGDQEYIFTLKESSFLDTSYVLFCLCTGDPSRVERLQNLESLHKKATLKNGRNLKS